MVYLKSNLTHELFFNCSTYDDEESIAKERDVVRIRASHQQGDDPNGDALVKGATGIPDETFSELQHDERFQEIFKSAKLVEIDRTQALRGNGATAEDEGQSDDVGAGMGDVEIDEVDANEVMAI